MALTVVRTSQALARVFSATLAPFGLPPHHFGVLLHLVERPGMSQADLARVVLATPQSVGELIRVMEDRGLVERTAPTRRGLPAAVFASEAGRAALDEVTPAVLAAFTPEALGLDKKTHDRLNVDLHAIMTALES